MPRAQITFQTRITIPGSAAEKPGGGNITYEQMMNTIDRAYDRGKWHGWQEAMRAVREAAAEGPEGMGPIGPRPVEDAIRAAADKCTLRTDA